MSTLQYINECSDAFTKLPASSIDNDLTSANSQFKMLNYYAYAIGGVVLIMFLWALIGTILAFKCVG